jgi:hypothetical protein
LARIERESKKGRVKKKSVEHRVSREKTKNLAAFHSVLDTRHSVLGGTQ